MASTTSLKLPEDLKERISALTDGVAQSPHAYMVDAIAERVTRDEKRKAFLEEGKLSMEDFKRTGIAYRHEDVAPFLRAIASGKKAVKPKPIRIPPSKR